MICFLTQIRVFVIEHDENIRLEVMFIKSYYIIELLFILLECTPRNYVSINDNQITFLLFIIKDKPPRKVKWAAVALASLFSSDTTRIIIARRYSFFTGA